MSDDLLIEEDNDQSSPDAEAVAAYLAANNVKNISLGGEPTPKEESKPEPEEHDDGNIRINLTASTEFEQSKRAVDDMFVTMQDYDVPITEDDRSLYIKATLYDQPFETEIEVCAGIKVRCRSLSIYEFDLCYDALALYIKDHPELPSAFLDGVVQQFKASMQVTAMNSQPAFGLSYVSENYDISQRQKDATDLLQRSTVMVQKMQGVRFGLIVKALNVFQHKLNRLQEAALNRDFWNPVATA